MREVVVLWMAGAMWSAATLAQPAALKFDFGPGPAGSGMTRVLPEAVYNDTAGLSRRVQNAGRPDPFQRTPLGQLKRIGPAL